MSLRKSSRLLDALKLCNFTWGRYLSETQVNFESWWKYRWFLFTEMQMDSHNNSNNLFYAEKDILKQNFGLYNVALHLTKISFSTPYYWAMTVLQTVVENEVKCMFILVWNYFHMENLTYEIYTHLWNIQKNLHKKLL